MMNESHPALNSSFIIPHSSLPFKLKAQAVNLPHVVGLALGVGRAARAYAACDARAVEGEFARRAVEPGARAPVRKAAGGERAVGSAHAPADRAEARVVGLRDKPACEVAPKMLAKYAPLAPERERDYEEHAEECRHHHEEVGQQDVCAVFVQAAQTRRSVPACVQEHSRQEADGGRDKLNSAAVGLRRESEADAG